MRNINYMELLTDHDILDILKELNFDLRPVFDKAGSVLPAIERQLDIKSKKQTVVAKCIRRSEEKTFSEAGIISKEGSTTKYFQFLTSYIEMLNLQNKNNSNNHRNKGIVVLMEFGFVEIFSGVVWKGGNMQGKIDNSYASIIAKKMYEKSEELGKSYIKDYNDSVRLLRKVEKRRLLHSKAF